MSTLADYPPEWPKISLQTKIDAEFRCVRCGHPNARWSPEGNDHRYVADLLRARMGLSKRPRIYHVDGGAWIRHHLIPCDARCTHDPAVRKWRILTVHHLDGVKENLAWWNLAALCQRCHLTIQGKVILDQTYRHVHTPWFRPYVAGYYARVVFGEDVTREEAESRLVELLIAGQPHLEDLYRKEIS